MPLLIRALKNGLRSDLEVTVYDNFRARVIGIRPNNGPSMYTVGKLSPGVLSRPTPCLYRQISHHKTWIPRANQIASALLSSSTTWRKICSKTVLIMQIPDANPARIHKLTNSTNFIFKTAPSIVNLWLSHEPH